MCLELIKDYPEEMDDMIACYCIGWALTKEDVEEYPQLVPASGETDTGVVVCFSSEAEEITDSFFIPEGSWSYSINPLNWKTDSTPADKELNLGACFTDYEGNITEEIPHLTGAYIDPERGGFKSNRCITGRLSGRAVVFTGRRISYLRLSVFLQKSPGECEKTSGGIFGMIFFQYRC